MITRQHVLGFVGLAAFAAMLYHAKNEAQAVRGQVADLEAKVTRERAIVRTLEAEAAFLERPDRLEPAAAGDLALVPVPARQIASLADLDLVAPLPAPTPTPAPAPAAPAPVPAPAPQQAPGSAQVTQ